MDDGARCGVCAEPLEAGEPHICATPATTVVERPRTPRDDDAGCPVAPGDLLAGRYRLEEVAGRGGSGTVFRAFDTELDTRVAVKVLAANAATHDVVARFKHEIRLTRAIDHPNVSRVHDLGEADGVTFLTMRWVDGQPLGVRLRAAPLSTPELVRLATGLTAALAAAHRIGVIHQDVKPSNVIFSSAGEPVLVDFGIALELDATAVSELRSLPAEAVAGTPPFMAPEQRRGQPVLATDLWGLALTLACAASGRPLPPPSPARALDRLPGPWRRALTKCLAERPEDRPRDASALARLAASTRWPRRSAWVALVVLAATAAAALALPAGERAADPVVYVAPLRNDTGDPALDWLSSGAASLLAHDVESAGGVAISHGEAPLPTAHIRGRIVRTANGPALALELTSHGRRIARERVDARGAALLRGSRAAAGHFLKALGRPAPRRGARTITDDAPAFEHWARAWTFARKHENEIAQRELREAVTRDPAFALAHMDRYVFLFAYSAGNEREIAEELAAARRHVDRLPGSRRALLEAMVEARTGTSPRRFTNLFGLLRARPADPAAYFLANFCAEADRGRRIQLLREWARRLPGDPEPHNQLGYILSSNGDQAAAERELREYIRLAPGEANPWDSLGDLERSRGKLAEALEAYQRALEIDPEFASSATGTIETLLSLEDLPGAEAALSRHGALLLPRPQHNRWVRAHLAVELLAGRPRDAEARLRSLAESPTSPDVADVARAYGAVLAALDGDPSRAAALVEQVTARDGARDLAWYTEALAHFRRGEEAEVVRVARVFATDSSRVLVTRGNFERKHLATTRLAFVQSLARAGALEAAARLPVVPLRSDAEGVEFLWLLERARALARRGATADAAHGFEEAIRLGSTAITTPEAAHEWRACLAEGARAWRAAGDDARGAELEERLARLSAAPPD